MNSIRNAIAVHPNAVLLRGGSVLDVDGERRADLRIGRDGRVAAVAPGLEPEPGEQVLECAGRLLVPGGVDVHTHLHLPVGRIRVSDDFDTETRAAAIGGTTTIVDYVTAYRGEDPMQALATWRHWAEPACIDYGLHMTFTERVPERAIASCVEAGITSFKLYMAYPELLQVDDDVISEIMRVTRKHGAFVTLHCENGGAIEALRRRAIAEGRTGVLEHANTRPAELEAQAVARACALAERAQTSVYVVHLSSAPALAAVREARDARCRCDRRDVSTVSLSRYRAGCPTRTARRTSAHHRCATRGTWRSCGTGSRRARCRRSRPTTARSRSPTGGPAPTRVPAASADFTEIPGGLPGIETRMGLVWEGVAAGRIARADWVRLCAEAPARTFGLWPAKGNLRVGADADVVVWDPARDQSLDAGALHMAVDHSPYHGMTVTGWPELVFARGDLVARDATFVGEPARGRYVGRVPRSS